MQKGKICLAVIVCLSTFVLGALFLLPCGLERTEAAVLAANKTEILLDGERILGLKGFTYKVYKDRQDVRGIGMNERIGLAYGEAEAQADDEGLLTLTTYGMPFTSILGKMRRPDVEAVVYEGLHVKARILVACPEEVIDALHQPPIHGFLDQAEEAMWLTSPVLYEHMENNTSFRIILMQDSYPEGLGIKKFTFDGCHVDDREFQIDSHGYALTTYTFTADRLREE